MTSGGESGRTEVLEEVGLSERHSGIAQDRVGGCRVEEEVGERKSGQICGADPAIAHAVGEAELDLASLTVGQSGTVKAVKVGNCLVAALAQLGKALLGIRHGGRVGAGEARECVLRRVR